MAKKPASKNSVTGINHESQWNKVLHDLTQTLSTTNRENAELASAAIKAASTLSDPIQQGKAKAALDALRKKVERIEREATRTEAEVRTRLRESIQSLRASEKAAIQAAKDQETRDRIKEEFAKKRADVQQAQEDRLLSSFENYAQQSTDLHKETLDVVRKLEEAEGEARRQYLEQIDTLLEKLDDVEEQQKKEFEATRKRRAKETQDELRPKKTRKQELEEELAAIGGSMFKRFVLQPLKNKATSGIAELVDGVKDRTGISAVQRLVEKERLRRDKMDELSFELNQIKNIGDVKDDLVREKQQIHASTSHLEQLTLRLTDVVNNLTGVKSRPLIPAAAMAGGAPSASEDVSSASRTRSLRSVVDSMRQPRSAGGDSYSNIQERELREREIRALEKLVGGGTGKDGKGFGVKDIALALGGVLASMASMLGKKLNIAGLGSKIAEGLKSLKTMLRAEWDKIPAALSKLKQLSLAKLDALMEASRTMASKLEPIYNKIRGTLSTALDGARSIADKAKTAGASGLNKAMSIAKPLVDGAKNINDKGSAAIRSGLSKAGNLVSETASSVKTSAASGLNKAQDLVSTGASMAKTAGTHAYGFISNKAGKAYDAAAQFAGKMMESGQKILSKIPGSKLVRHAGRLAARAAVPLEVILGALDEASGKKIESYKDFNLWDLFPPSAAMKGGRLIGNKFNTLFEKQFGNSIGGLVYDLMNEGDPNAGMTRMYPTTRSMDPGTASMSSPMSIGGPSSMRAGVNSMTTPNQISVPSGFGADTPSGYGVPSLSAAQNSTAPSQSSGSVTPVLHPSAIPNYISLDPRMAVINLGRRQ